MAIDLCYDRSLRLLLTRFSGVLTDKDFECLEQSAIGHQAWSKEIVDLRSVQRAEASQHTLQHIAHGVRSKPDKYRNHSVAIVAPAPVTYGMARQYAAFCEVLGASTRVEVFRTLEEALTWLGLSEDRDPFELFG